MTAEPQHPVIRRKRLEVILDHMKTNEVNWPEVVDLALRGQGAVSVSVRLTSDAELVEQAPMTVEEALSPLGER